MDTYKRVQVSTFNNTNKKCVDCKVDGKKTSTRKFPFTNWANSVMLWLLLCIYIMIFPGSLTIVIYLLSK